MTRFFEALGLNQHDLGEDADAARLFSGAIFPAGESWIEVWQQSARIPPGLMLQLVVDDADAFALHAELHGLVLQGPVDAHGERVYMVSAPNGLAVSLQSVLPHQP